MDRSPRVRCRGCSFAWFGATSAHGLRIVGSCPRCGGELEFLVAEAEDADAAAQRDREFGDEGTPSTVLGVPLGWDR
jgi:hypothetical protein